LFQSKLLK